jgi:hypothetical protein
MGLSAFRLLRFQLLALTKGRKLVFLSLGSYTKLTVAL